jgi:hypothetical protein
MNFRSEALWLFTLALSKEQFKREMLGTIERLIDKPLYQIDLRKGHFNDIPCTIYYKDTTRFINEFYSPSAELTTLQLHQSNPHLFTTAQYHDGSDDGWRRWRDGWPSWVSARDVWIASFSGSGERNH